MADAISDLMLLLNKDDIKDFKAFLKRKNKRNDVKNIKLLEIIETDDINKLKKLYDPIKNRDAYHALRKRLHDSLLFFLSNKVFERDNNEAHEALRFIVVGCFLLDSQFIKIGFKCLQRAEDKALVLEQFSLLNEILQIRLQYAHLDLNVNLELLIDRFTENQQKLQREAKFQIAYALLRSELQAIHLKAKIIDLNKLILSTLSKYRISLDDLLSFKSLYQLLYIANEYAAIHQNYTLVRSFLKTADNFLMTYDQQSKHNLFYYLHILYYLANFNLRNGFFNESMVYLERLKEVLSQGNAVFRAQFQLRCHLLMALNFHYLGDGIKGLSVLRAGIKQAPAKSNEVDLADLQLCLVMFLTQFEDKTALIELRQLIRTDAWYEKKMGMLWTIRKSLLEILIHIQFKHIDLATFKLKSFVGRYKKYLLNVKENRVIDFVKLVEKYLLNPTIIQVKSFREAVEALVKNEENKDLFVMGFLAWLKALVMSQNPYQVLLRLMKEDI